MNAYIYAAALHCTDCATAIKALLDADGKTPEDVSDERSYDSDDYPKGPLADGGGAADSPQHCDSCGLFLENDLTEEGLAFVRDVIQGHADGKPGNREASAEWGAFYDVHPEYPDADEDDEQDKAVEITVEELEKSLLARVETGDTNPNHRRKS